jgi:hypothetical protein
MLTTSTTETDAAAGLTKNSSPDRRYGQLVTVQDQKPGLRDESARGAPALLDPAMRGDSPGATSCRRSRFDMPTPLASLRLIRTGSPSTGRGWPRSRKLGHATKSRFCRTLPAEIPGRA